MSDPWQALERELDLWAEGGATFWWRDDDAVAPSEALARLLHLSGQHRAPLALAVIPAGADARLGPALATMTGLVVLQHGYAHRDHRVGPGKKIELTATRPTAVLEDELRLGRDRMSGLFGARFLPVMVPPWNRIDGAVAARLPRLGFRGLSTYGPRPDQAPAGGLQQVNCHLDLLRWTDPRGFLGLEPAITLAVEHLRARREGQVDPDEPTGILSHHLAHDAAAWAFLTDLLARLLEHPAARIVDPAELFPEPR